MRCQKRCGSMVLRHHIGKRDFFGHILRGGESYAAKWSYVRDNPVRAGLVKHPDKWSFLGEIFGLEFRNDGV
jgi:hypothetical protein